MILRREFITGAVATLAMPKLIVSLVDFGAEPGADTLFAFRAALAVLARNGGGVLYVPPNATDWIVSDTVFIRQSNVTIKLAANVRLVAVAKRSVFVFEGYEKRRHIENVAIVGVGKARRIDGNARQVQHYNYSTSDTFYSCVVFKWCSAWHVENVYGFNGLVNCLRAFECGSGEMRDCWSSDCRYDNGQSIDFCNGTETRIVNIGARSWKCAAFGVTSYSSSHIDIIDAEIYDCGNDDPTAPVSGGGLSVEGDYFKSARENRNYDVRVIRPHIKKCFNAGAFITSPGVTMIEPWIEETRGAVNRKNPMGEKGANLYCLAACDLEVVRGRLVSAHGSGIFVLGNDGYRPELKFDGIVDHSAGYGIYSRKTKTPEISRRSKISRSGIADVKAQLF